MAFMKLSRLKKVGKYMIVHMLHVLCVITLFACSSDYPFENKPHTQFWGMKGYIREVQISAERADIKEKGYDVFQKTNIANREFPPFLFCGEYFCNDIPFHGIENINMYYIPFTQISWAIVVPKVSNIAISFDEKGYIANYKLYDKGVTAFNLDFSYRNSLLKSIQSQWPWRSKASYKSSNNNDYNKYDDLDRILDYDTISENRFISFGYEDNYINKVVEEYRGKSKSPKITNYRYEKSKNTIKAIITTERKIYNGTDSIDDLDIDSLYLYLDKNYKATKAVYYDGKKESNILLRDGHVCGVLPNVNNDYEYDDMGRVGKYKDYDIEYNVESGLIKSIVYRKSNDIRIVYDCEYVFDSRGNWIQVNIEPKNRLYYDYLVNKIAQNSDDVNFLEESDFKTMDDIFDLAHKKAELVALDYLKKDASSAYSKYVVKRKIDYYK